MFTATVRTNDEDLAFIVNHAIETGQPVRVNGFLAVTEPSWAKDRPSAGCSDSALFVRVAMRDTKQDLVFQPGDIITIDIKPAQRRNNA